MFRIIGGWKKPGRWWWWGEGVIVPNRRHPLGGGEFIRGGRLLHFRLSMGGGRLFEGAFNKKGGGHLFEVIRYINTSRIKSAKK